MGKLKYSLVLASVLVASPFAAANAADLGLPPPEPMPVPAPIPVTACCETGGLYLKGFFGVTNQETDGFTNETIDTNAGAFTIIDHSFDSSPFVGVGIGYDFSRRFRFDLTGEYRGKSNFRGLDTYFDAGGACGGDNICTNEYEGIKSEWLMMTNAYWDIATVHGITPYVGAGVGLAAVTLRDFQDVNQEAGAIHWAEDNTEWNFAWALHAGVAYEISDALTLDMAYRYVNMGDGETGQFSPAATNPGALTVEDIESHDVMVGLRWQWDKGGACCGTPAYVETSYPAPYK